MKYPEENLLLDLTLRREKSIEFYQSGKWCQGYFGQDILGRPTPSIALPAGQPWRGKNGGGQGFWGDDAASCQGALFVVFCRYESYKPSSLFLLTPGKRGSGEPSQPEPAIRGRVDSNRRGRSAAGFFLSTGNGLLGDVQGPLEDRTDAL